MGAIGGVDPHTSSGPIPGFFLFGCFDLQSGKYGRQQGPDCDRASAAIRMLSEDSGDHLRFTLPRMIRQLVYRGLQVGQYLVHRCLVYVMKMPQLLQDRVRILECRVLHGLGAGDTGKGHSSKLVGRLDPACFGVEASRSIDVRKTPVMRTVARQALGDPHQRTSYPSIRFSDQRPF